jgi:hypothetical protein
MSIWTIGWLLWIGFFVIEEGVALTNKVNGDTLSEHVWKWFAIPEAGTKEDGKRPKTVLMRLRRFALLAFMAWLVLHFVTGGKF